MCRAQMVQINDANCREIQMSNLTILKSFVKIPALTAERCFRKCSHIDFVTFLIRYKEENIFKSQ